jgi:hypothetical protein
MKIKIGKGFFVLLMLGAAFLAWRAIDRAINVPDASTWLAPILLVSLFAMTAYVNIIAVKKALHLQGIFLLAFLSSFVFAQSLWHAVGFIPAYLLALGAITRIKGDLLLNVRINVWKSIRAGSGLFVFALSLLISSQYYSEVKNLDKEKLIPQFYVSSITGNLTTRFLAATNPEVKNADQERLTVDQFIMQNQSGELQSGGVSFETTMQINEMIDKVSPNASEAQKDIIKESVLQRVQSVDAEMEKQRETLLLQEGRKRFSEMTGKNIQGDEKMSDVLADIVNKKIDQYFGSGAGEGKASTLPYIMAIILFLTILPLGSILNISWVIAAEFFIWVLLKAGVVSIRKMQVEAEVLE